ncbi:hypothetical protein EJ04DRAFT_591358 [Polyplosphaeria fusca]|uniref:Zn(2)-C6 fungal-type domain-containing protein n=1 Tax=Polyplosphaeria fusca TaxID=682080 RepID=A0A9P4QMU8_9PLEO|nr:hypothetical protein EJ04DRAFT_591358 [Polyplosphaeria fusca]
MVVASDSYSFERRRRVKCDEMRPHCQRCIKSNLQTVTIAHPIAVSTRLPDETEVENRYMQYFHQETTSGFQSAWDWSLWNRLMLQGCHHEPFVRHAVVAIGALHKALRAPSSTVQGTGAEHGDKSLSKLHREFAYLSYGKALKMMQAAIDTSLSPRHALIACLLIVCFESHTGNRYKAGLHARYGLEILQQWTSQGQVDYEKKPSVVSPSPADVEDEIVEAFRNLDITLVTVNDSRKPALHERLMKEDSYFVQSMPQSFYNVTEAKRYWIIIMRRSCHFLATTWHRTDPHSLTRAVQTPVPGSVTVTVGDTIHTTANRVDEKVRSISRQYSRDVSRWLEAFEATFSKIRRADSSTQRDIVVATTLKIHALSIRITLAGVCFLQEILYDAFLTDFRSIVSLCKDIFLVRRLNPDNDPGTGTFHLDLGLVEPLFRVILRCRDAELRREAFEMLESWHVEGWWDPGLIVAICRFIVDVEERGMVDGFIPEEARAILTAKCHYPPEQRLLVQCVQRTKEGLKWTEGFVEW